MQTISFNFLKEFIQWVSPFRIEEYGFWGACVLQQELDSLSKAFVEIFEKSAVKLQLKLKLFQKINLSKKKKIQVSVLANVLHYGHKCVLSTGKEKPKMT